MSQITLDDKLLLKIKQLYRLEDVVKSDITDGSFRETKTVCACKCPFHNEDTSSFYVFKDSQEFHCFGCGVGGDIFSYVMMRDGITLDKAIEKLAREKNIELENKQPQLKRLYSINKVAALFFINNLKKDKTAMNYFKNRELSDDTIKKFGLGYAGKNNELYKILIKKGFSEQEILAAGIMSKDEKTGRIKNRFFGRVMFPIITKDNKIAGFGGRVLDDSEPKYLNTPETDIFEKRLLLFGESFDIPEKPYILCEGYMDVISLRQSGFNAFASLGTALTKEQCLKLKDKTDMIYLSYDSDGPGIKSTIKNIDTINSIGMNTKIIDLKPYKDPDEVIKNEGMQGYYNRILNAKNSDVYLREMWEKENDSKKIIAEKTADRIVKKHMVIER